MGTPIASSAAVNASDMGGVRGENGETET
jgi:hypothetical protein